MSFVKKILTAQLHTVMLIMLNIKHIRQSSEETQSIDIPNSTRAYVLFLHRSKCFPALLRGCWMFYPNEDMSKLVIIRTSTFFDLPHAHTRIRWRKHRVWQECEECGDVATISQLDYTTSTWHHFCDIHQGIAEAIRRRHFV